MLLHPCGQLQRPDAKTHRVPSVQGGELLQNQFDEVIFVCRNNCGRHFGKHACLYRGLVVLHDGGHYFAQGLAVAQTENVWRHQIF